jgi:FkbM family methyltransferase
MKSNSQAGQDDYVISKLNNKKNGYFVELGAGDGVYLSNTYKLEKDYNWTGLLIEPSFKFYEISKHRSCKAIKACISDQKSQTIFVEGNSDDWNSSGHVYLSGIQSSLEAPVQINGSWVLRNKVEGNKITVDTLPLASVLEQVNAPNIIDYLSLDVEGHEWTILRNFPFDKYRFRVMTIEHNGAEPNRTNIRKLLESKGYRFDCCLGHLDDCFLMNA